LLGASPNHRWSANAGGIVGLSNYEENVFGCEGDDSTVLAFIDASAGYQFLFGDYNASLRYRNFGLADIFLSGLAFSIGTNL
jgi:hypothetical protein